MPLVFVHGVSVRKDARYNLAEEARNGLFREYALTAVTEDASNVRIENPYWGQYGATLAWNSASLPDGHYEDFGQAESVFEEILTDLASDIHPSAPDQILVTLARTSMERAVDCLWSAGAHTDSERTNGADLAALSKQALKYVKTNPRPKWLDSASDDNQFVEKLLTSIIASKRDRPSIESFGISEIWNHLKKATIELANRGTALVLNPAVRAVRPWVNGKISIFLGDVFVYLRTRDAPLGSKIVQEVQGAFERANKARTKDDSRLVIVAHSMGGNISYDILTSFAPNIQVDVFLTVGSQVGMFEELKLFKNSKTKIRAPQKVKIPRNIKKWINVMDPNDVLAYSTGRIFAGSKDARFDSRTPVWAAHTTYFSRPYFHERLRKRIIEAVR